MASCMMSAPLAAASLLLPVTMAVSPVASKQVSLQLLERSNRSEDPATDAGLILAMAMVLLAAIAFWAALCYLGECLPKRVAFKEVPYSEKQLLPRQLSPAQEASLVAEASPIERAVAKVEKIWTMRSRQRREEFQEAQEALYGAERHEEEETQRRQWLAQQAEQPEERLPAQDLSSDPQHIRSMIVPSTAPAVPFNSESSWAMESGTLPPATGRSLFR
eukprot:TRINITY_DN35300_c0_g1_i1.p1 TRINITY_DN35300_c0_g1~~TRINITY_DN35300_c0_g1_i1.p1  ORF type:complete len:236 (+),score=47.71 TRINITY_DN35300_c0_g1_i1:54-710(+)